MQLTLGGFIKRATVSVFDVILGQSGEGGASPSPLCFFMGLGKAKILNYKVNVYILSSSLVQLCQESEKAVSGVLAIATLSWSTAEEGWG